MYPGLYSIGDKDPAWEAHDVLVQVHFRDPFWELAVGYPSITDEEIYELEKGDIKMAFTSINGLLFLLFSFGRIPWCDAPYEPRLTNTPLNYPVFDGKGEGAPLLVCVVDSDTGELRAMRLVGMGNMLSNRLHAACRELDKQRPLNLDSYRWQIQKAYRKYPRSDMMLKTVQPTDIFALLGTAPE